MAWKTTWKRVRNKRFSFIIRYIYILYDCWGLSVSDYCLFHSVFSTSNKLYLSCRKREWIFDISERDKPRNWILLLDGTAWPAHIINLVFFKILLFFSYPRVLRVSKIIEFKISLKKKKIRNKSYRVWRAKKNIRLLNKIKKSFKFYM